MERVRIGALALCTAALGAAPAAAQVGLKKASAIVHAFVQDGQACPGFPASNDGFSVSRNVTLDASGATRFEIDLPVGIPPPKALRSPLFDR